MKKELIAMLTAVLLFTGCTSPGKYDAYISQQTVTIDEQEEKSIPASETEPETTEAETTKKETSETASSETETKKEKAATAQTTENSGSEKEKSEEERIRIDYLSDSWLRNLDFPDLGFQNCVPIVSNLTISSSGVRGLYYPFCRKCHYLSDTVSMFGLDYGKTKRYDYHCDLCGEMTVVKFSLPDE